MHKEQFQELLVKDESTYLDWKKDFPIGLLHGKKHNDWDMGRGKVLKSIIALANSHGSENAYLVYGVKSLSDSRNVTGISKSFDDADFQQWAENTFDPAPTFSYSELQWDTSINVGIFQIKRTPNYPHVVTTNLGGILFEGQVWFRRGSKNTVALYQDLKSMFKGDTPFKISRLDDPIMDKITQHYKGIGKDCVLPRLSDKDSYLARGYELATYPGTRQEVWVGAVGNYYEHILLLKPSK
jgi:hypothetical protein